MKNNFFTLPNRKSVLCGLTEYGFFNRMLIFLYCNVNKWDIAALFINLHLSKFNNSFFYFLFSYLAGKQGYINNYSNGQYKLSSKTSFTLNPFYRNRDEIKPIPIFIGVNQTGSWSVLKYKDEIKWFRRKVGILRLPDTTTNLPWSSSSII